MTSTGKRMISQYFSKTRPTKTRMQFHKPFIAAIARWLTGHKGEKK